MLKRFILPLLAVCALGAALGCDDLASAQPTSDQVQAQQQEHMAAEATAQTGMPAIKNFRERKMLKDILELRDQNGIVTYTYLVSATNGKLRYFGQTIGYGIPYATQYTNPQKIAAIAKGGSQAADNFAILPQADPNGLFSPASADGTWVLMKDPAGDKVLPIYLEPRIVVSPFKLPESMLARD
jgi:hypothetical protein